MDITQIVQSALEVEKSGIPVDWKSLCINVTNTAIKYAEAKEDEIERLAADLQEGAQE